ncbi:MAG: class I SAM-dependent methyltransferase [Candidatus Auribacterota bacterium]|nr:class I SAM-dependent methyltransferase [Candidatus Auribacterota bacterium]
MREREHFNRLAAETGSTWWGRTTPAGRLRDRKKIDLFFDIVRPSPGERLLETGCGTGEFTRMLDRFGLNVIAFDLAEGCVEAARRSVAPGRGYEFAAADIASLPFRDNSFDICLGVSILHHIPVEQCWPEIIRVCRPGARFFFSEPNMLNPWVMIEKNIGWVKRRLEDSEEESAFYRWRLEKLFNSYPGTEAHVVNIDFIHPLVPEFILPAVEKMSGVLEKLPLLREISGSLAIYGTILSETTK